MAAEWDIESFYEKSFSIVKRQPKLWIAGLAVATLAVSGSSFNGSSNSGGSDSNEATASASINLPDQFSINTSALEEGMYRIANAVVPAVRAVPTATYVGLAVEGLVAGLIGLGVALLSSAWSRGLLIHAVKQATDLNSVSLTTAGLAGLKRWKTMLAIDVIPWLRVWLLMAGMAAALGISAAFQLVGVGALIAIGLLIYLVLYLFRMLFAQIWAYRAAIEADISYAEAMSIGFQLSRGNRKRMLLLGIINTIASGIVSGVLFLVVSSVSIAAIIRAVMNPSTESIMTAVITGVISLIAAQPILKAKDSLIHAFIYNVWHQAFVSVKEPTHETAA